MGKTLLLSLSLTLLLLFHGSLAYRKNQQQQLQNECQIDRLDALEPSNRVESEAGVVETWDPNDEQFQCSGVAIVRETIQPNGLVLPYSSNAPTLVYIVKGTGLTSTAVPGCPETFQSPQGEFHRGGQQRGSSQDRHQKVERFKEGDLLVLPAGMAHWCYNDGDTPVVAVSFIHVKNDANQLDTSPREFYLAGNPQDPFQQQQQQRQPLWRTRGKGQQQREQQQQSSCNNMFCGFDSQLLAQALNVDQSLIERIQDDNDDRGAIVKVKGDLQVIRPPMSRRQEESETEYESESQSQREGGRNGIEETFCTMKLKQNIGDPSRADVYTPGVGGLITANRGTLRVLDMYQLSFEKGKLQNEAVMTPHWNVNAHSIMYALRGKAFVQIVDNNGDSVFEGEFKEGQVLTIPQNFAVVIKARGQNFDWVAMKTNNDAMISPLSGRTSALMAMPEDVLSNAFGISRQEVRSLKFNNQQQTTFSSGRSSGGDMDNKAVA